MKSFPVALLAILGLMHWAIPLASQTLEPEQPPALEQAPATLAARGNDRQLIEILEALHASLAAKQSEVSRLEERLEVSTNDTARGEIARQLEQSASELVRLEHKFAETASTVDLALFFEPEEKPFSWEEEVGSLLKPVLAEIESATAQSRVLAQLREENETLTAQRDAARKAIASIESLLPQAGSEALRGQLREQLQQWRERETIASNEARAARLRIRNLEAQSEGLLDSSTHMVKRFFGSRGLNLLLAAAAFLAVFFGVRFTYWMWQKATRRKGRQSLSNRVLALAVHTISILGAVGATIIVFNMRGDWFMLGLILILLVGVLWAGIKTLPQYIESMKLILNIGSVREGEHLVFHGLPWEVETLGFSSHLKNPHLEGGQLRMPVSFLVGELSRPLGENERLFPTDAGDWVSLADGRIGEVLRQTPSQVFLRELGGAEICYQTADFLAQSPRNLSCGFRIETTFGIDYDHQAIATTQVPQLMREALQQQLGDLLAPETIRQVRVSFAQAGASSLDYRAQIDLTGEAAPDYQQVEFALQRILVETCNEQGWRIPFTQLTIHQSS